MCWQAAAAQLRHEKNKCDLIILKRHNNHRVLLRHKQATNVHRGVKTVSLRLNPDLSAVYLVFNDLLSLSILHFSSLLLLLRCRCCCCCCICILLVLPLRRLSVSHCRNRSASQSGTLVREISRTVTEKKRWEKTAASPKVREQEDGQLANAAAWKLKVCVCVFFFFKAKTPSPQDHMQPSLVRPGRARHASRYIRGRGKKEDHQVHMTKCLSRAWKLTSLWNITEFKVWKTCFPQTMTHACIRCTYTFAKGVYIVVVVSHIFPITIVSMSEKPKQTANSIHHIVLVLSSEASCLALNLNRIQGEGTEDHLPDLS